MATDKNIIKNWFRNGLKPTQEQFWAWQDSYFHKSEKIPQQQIEGLADSLSNKADASQLNGKADLVDGKVPESQLPLLKDNTKVDKPTIDGNWVVNKTEDVISWVSADSFGKNMANSQLVTTVGAGVTQGANYTWDTAGYYLYFKGLPNKYADAKFDKKVVIDSNGQVAISEREDITINIPETFNGSASLGSITIGVNHIYPQAIPNRPSFADEIQQIMANYKNINFTLISRGQWILWTKGNKGLSANSIDSDGFFSLDGYNSDFKDYDSTNLVVDLYSDVSLPSDRNWILKITGFLETGYGGGNIYFGVSRSGDSNIAFGIEPTSYARLKAMGDTQGEYVLRNNFLCIILKVGGVIFTSIYGGGRNNFNTSNAYTELGNYTPRVTINKNQGKISGKMSYKILD